MFRISKTAWLKEEEHEDVGHVYTRTHQVTGLNMETSEELQVSNYGIGGHYEPHFDFARREEKNAFASLGTGNFETKFEPSSDFVIPRKPYCHIVDVCVRCGAGRSHGVPSPRYLPEAQERSGGLLVQSSSKWRRR